MAAPLLGGCSVKGMVLNNTIDALTTGTGGFGSDDDPELIRGAVPFGLKTLESLYGEAPEHVGLLTALASGFTQYAYAFVQLDGDLVKYEDYAAYKAARQRANKLYLRGLEYGLQGLEVNHPGLRARLDTDLAGALAELDVDDVPLIYWTGAAWGGAISTGSDNLTLLANLGKASALLARGLELDEDYDTGAFHELFISLDMAPSGAGPESATRHYQRALELGGGFKAGPHVTYADSVLVPAQDLEGFRAALEKALAIDVDEYTPNRLVNILAQHKAQYLLDHTEDLIGG